MKEELYDEICRTLTDYEHPDELPEDERTSIDWTETFYELLVKVQSNVNIIH